MTGGSRGSGAPPAPTNATPASLTNQQPHHQHQQQQQPGAAAGARQEHHAVGGPRSHASPSEQGAAAPRSSTSTHQEQHHEDDDGDVQLQASHAAGGKAAATAEAAAVGKGAAAANHHHQRRPSAAASRDRQSSSSSGDGGPVAKLWRAVQPLLGRYAAPALLAAGAAAWLLQQQQQRRSSAGDDDDGNSSAGSSRRVRQRRASAGGQQQRQRGGSSSSTQAAPQAPPEPPEPESTLAVYASDFSLPTSEVSLVARPAVLEGATCVVAEHLPVAGAPLGAGLPPLLALQQHQRGARSPADEDSAGGSNTAGSAAGAATAAGALLPARAPATCAFVHRFLTKGFSIVGQGSIQPCNYPSLGTNLRNPVAARRVAGGGASGALAAVALGEADVALATDWLGSARLPAACMSQYALVCTPGALGQGSLSSEAAAAEADPAYAPLLAAAAPAAAAASASSSSSRRGSSGSIEAAAIAAGELGLIRRAAEYLALPGMADLRGDLTQVVVAEDLFSLCEPEMEDALLSMKRAVIHWAGQEQAGSVQLIPFLETNCSAWRRLLAAADASPLAAARTASGHPLPPVLRALTYAAQLMLHAELAQRYGGLAAAAEAEAGGGSSGGAGAGGEELLVGVQQWSQDPLVAAALAQGATASPEELQAAHETAAEVQELLSKAVKHDVVVVVPCVPAAPPRVDAPPAQLDSWLARCHAFAALTSLGGCPCVVLPVAPADAASRDAGSAPPLSLALFGHSRSDQRLLTVAERLAVHAQAEYRKLQDKHAADAAASAAAAAAAAPDGAAASSDVGGGKAAGRRGAGKQQAAAAAAGAVDGKRAAKAEKAKERGNDAFKQGKYREAIRAYSEASKLDPSNPVYLSNRALSHLKLFSFEAAEADCNAVLAMRGLSPADRVKALLRRGTARLHKSEADGAKADFQAALALEPNNRQARDELKALQQQEREMQEERLQAMAAAVQHGAAAGARREGGSGGGSSNGGMSRLPPGLLESLAADPAAAAAVAAQLQAAAAHADGSGGSGSTGAPGDPGWAQLEAMLQSGSVPVVLGQDGQPVSGPRGEPVIVGPGGQEMTVEPSGGMQPYRRKQQQQQQPARRSSKGV